MNKILLLAFFLPFLSLAQQNKIGKVSQSINTAKAISGEFESFEIFNSEIKSASENYSDAVEDGVVVAINQTKINEIINQDPKQMQLSIPFKTNGEIVALDLIQVAVFSPDFKASCVLSLYGYIQVPPILWPLIFTSAISPTSPRLI